MANDSVAGPSSAIGITRFFDVDTGGPKFGPEMIVGVAIAFIILVIAVRIFSGAGI